ncbi:unnamed protein product, partial [Didymodactylos carnosus]
TVDRGDQQLSTTTLSSTMSKVKRIKFYVGSDEEMLTLELFQFIKQTFTRARILILNEFYHLQENVRREHIQLNTIEELQYNTYKIDKRILSLLPNVRRKICLWLPYEL